MLSGKGDYYVNGQREELAPQSFLVVSHGSRLSVNLPQAPSQPGLLFFHSGLVSRVMESLELPAEKLLQREGAAQGGGDGLPVGAGFSGKGRVQPVDLSFLERIHSGQPGIYTKLSWLAGQADSCSSFGALKADFMIRSVLEEILLQNYSALHISRRLTVIKRSTRIELFKRLSGAREWILENSALPLTLEDMAKTAMMNSQHFLRMFRQCYGITPHQLLVETRLDQGKRMLTVTDERISVICDKAGFESFSSFSWLFRQRYGSTPTAFRNLSR